MARGRAKSGARQQAADTSRLEGIRCRRHDGPNLGHHLALPRRRARIRAEHPQRPSRSSTLGAQARQSNATPHIHSSHLACGYAYTPPAKLPGEGGLSVHRSSESWRAKKCDRPCESDGTSDAVASSARMCVEAASQPRDDGTRPSGQHRFEGMLNQSDVVSDCYASCSKSVFWSLRSTTSDRGGTERLDRRSRRRQAGSPSGSVPSVGKAELAGKAEYISEQARSGKKSTRSHKAEETAKLSEMPS